VHGVDRGGRGHQSAPSGRGPGLNFAQTEAAAFLAAGGVGRMGWREQPVTMHRAFVARNLSPGGCGDLLAMALFIDRLEA
jgi:triphosphoribosyl-dephospho-CoA synthase